MTDKPKDHKVVSLKAIPKEAPTEDKKYKVKQELIDELQVVVDSLKQETDYEIAENVISALLPMLRATQSGIAHDVFCMTMHKDSVWVEGCCHVVSFCKETAASPYKFILLIEEVLGMRVEEIKSFMSGVYEDE